MRVQYFLLAWPARVFELSHFAIIQSLLECLRISRDRTLGSDIESNTSVKAKSRTTEVSLTEFLRVLIVGWVITYRVSLEGVKLAGC
jgi:hypothetical protein